MNRVVQPDAGLPDEESKTVLPGKDQAVLVEVGLTRDMAELESGEALRRIKKRRR